MVATTVGLGFLATLTFAIGALGGLGAWQVLGGFSVISLGLGWTARGSISRWALDARQWWSSQQQVSWFELAILALLGAFEIMAWVGALAPETSFDALSSHLALAKTFAMRGQVAAIPELMGSYWPLNGDMLLLTGFLGAGEVGAKLMHFLAGLVTAGLVHALGKQLKSRPAGLLAALIFYSTPIVGWGIHRGIHGPLPGHVRCRGDGVPNGLA